MRTPLVSVITPTWQRADLLVNRCIPSVQAQDYPVVEHIIVSDGPDQLLRDYMETRRLDRRGAMRTGRRYDTRDLFEGDKPASPLRHFMEHANDVALRCPVPGPTRPSISATLPARS